MGRDASKIRRLFFDFVPMRYSATKNIRMWKSQWSQASFRWARFLVSEFFGSDVREEELLRSLHNFPGVALWFRNAFPDDVSLHMQLVLFLTFCVFVPLHAYIADSALLYNWAVELRERFDLQYGTFWRENNGELQRELQRDAPLRFSVDLTRAMALVKFTILEDCPLFHDDNAE